MYGFIAGLFVILASIVGSLSGLIFKKITHKINDTILGFAAGVMLAAAFIGLLPQAFESKGLIGIGIGVVGVIVGAIFISGIDKFVPHVHIDAGNGSLVESESKSLGKTNKVVLLIIAIAIHNIPEGLATGIAFSGGMTDNAKLIAVSMLIQKIPEGLIVMVPLLAMGMKKSKAIGISVIVGLMMLPGLIVGILLGTLPPMLISFFSAFTFGAIIYVISDEIIPESHEHGFQRSATFALIVGILAVMVIQVLLV